MNLLSDIITYVRRIIKTPSNAAITDSLIIDYINRFFLMDMDARVQLFDLKTKYQFQTIPGVDKYNMPLYDAQVQPGNQTIGMFPVYQGFLGPAYVNGVQVHFETQKQYYFNNYPNVTQNLTTVGIGDGTAGPYTFNIPIISNTAQSPLNPPLNGLIRGHVDITGIIATGANVDPPLVTSLNTNIPVTSVDSAVFFTSIDAEGNSVVIQDSGQFLSNNVNYGLLMRPGKAPYGNTALPNDYVSSFVITNITQASQAVITANNTLSAGQTVIINNVLGMTELNGNTYTVVSANATTVVIDVDSTGFTAYISGGTINSIQNVINYLTGVATNVFFPVAIPQGANINFQGLYFQSGLPRTILYYNNVLTLRSPPDRQYLVELDAYLTPAAFLDSSLAIPFGYMAEYIARGAARKILSDTGDIEQFNFYEPLFLEQENLVHIRSQRQWTSTRTQTIYSTGPWQGASSGYGGQIQ